MKQDEGSNFLKQAASWRNRNQQFYSQVRAIDQTAYPLQTSVASLAADWWMEPWPPALFQAKDRFTHEYVLAPACDSKIHTHTTLSQTSLSHTHTTLSPTPLWHTALSHNLSPTIYFVFSAFPIPFSHLFCAYWKKLTCGVIRSFNFPNPTFLNLVLPVR